MSESQYNRKSWKAEDIARLKQIVNEGCDVQQEIDDLKAGLSETVKAIAEELEIKPSQINKAIKIAHKRNFQDEQDAFDEVADILDAVGKKY